MRHSQLLELAHDLDIVARAAAPGAQLADQGEVVSGQRTLRKFELTEAGQTTRLLFDPQTHLLAELEYRAAQNDGMGESKEVATRKVYGDYRPAAGFPYPHTLTQFRDGVQALEPALSAPRRPETLARAVSQWTRELGLWIAGGFALGAVVVAVAWAMMLSSEVW